MIRINAAWLIGIDASISALDNLSPEQSVGDAITILFGAQGALEQVFDQSLYRDQVKASRTAAKELHAAITQLIDPNEDWSKNIPQWTVGNLKNLKGTFRTVFLADLGVMPIYIVAKKDNFDVNLLIETGVHLFPPAIMAKVPEVEKDAAEVGRALAYELPTACGFHAFRVIESVLRRYWDATSERKKRPKLQTLGNFAAEMEKHKLGDEKVVWPAPGSEDTELGVLMEPEVGHGETEVYTRVQA
jgi:hypothetical protein